ncbi:hypothetical protein EV382_1889 [Micromonospora violae]|uniref:DinB family protein n=1 Tax=Micromonospora violae TaxID=1278207 RepID=A0A4Q7UC02_9ACTN|nr:hypothetical protein [Micromonospora violae]RZT78697.1 hypothetical protein EV382_1889 [Micromonospora violae]
MVTLDETVRRLAADRDVLMDRTADRTEEELSAGYRVRGGPLGHFCESLRDLVARGALIDDLSRYDEQRWSAPVNLSDGTSRSMGELARHVMTVPGHEPYWHAAIHLGELAAAA